MEYTEFWDFMVLLLGLLYRTAYYASIITRMCIYRLVDRGALNVHEANETHNNHGAARSGQTTDCLRQDRIVAFEINEIAVIRRSSQHGKLR